MTAIVGRLYFKACLCAMASMPFARPDTIVMSRTAKSSMIFFAINSPYSEYFLVPTTLIQVFSRQEMSPR